MNRFSRAIVASIGICLGLGVLAIVAKVTGAIDLPWWVVVIPLWAPFAAVFGAGVVLALGSLAASALEEIRGRS
jgi:hypothetical protein